MSAAADVAAAGPAPDGAGAERIRLEDVSRVYQVGDSSVRALDHVTLSIRAGEFVAVMGPSGSGKSTLLNVLGCLDAPTAGAYWLDGRPTAGRNERELAATRREKIGFIFQSYHLVPRMTAARNVELPLILAGVDPAERRARVSEALAAMGLAGRARHRPDQLSGGERQRVAIARAMVTRPTIVLADEPTGNLDSRTGAEIVEVLERLHRAGETIVLVSHDPAVAGRAHRLLRMKDGRIVEDEPVPGNPP